MPKNKPVLKFLPQVLCFKNGVSSGYFRTSEARRTDLRGMLFLNFSGKLPTFKGNSHIVFCIIIRIN